MTSPAPLFVCVKDDVKTQQFACRCTAAELFCIEKSYR
jgi:hypothetical protein